MAALRIGILISLSAILVLSGVLRRPGIGIITTCIVIGFLLWRGDLTWNHLGFRATESWVITILTALALGVVFSLGSIALLEPLVERWTGVPHDFSIIEGVRGHTKALIQWLVIVWLLVAVVEEFIFRGYLMTETTRWWGQGALGTFGALIVNALIFGLSHWYQGPSGGISTGIVGFLLGVVFLLGGKVLWTVILLHGFIDTFAILLIFANLDRRLKYAFIKPTKVSGRVQEDPHEFKGPSHLNPTDNHHQL